MPASPDVFRALGALCEPPDPAHTRLAAALGLPAPPDAATFTDVFVFQLVPYAAPYLSPDGMLGGQAADRVAGFWRALQLTPPPEPDHLAALLSLYAALAERESAEIRPDQAGAWREARRALLWEHLLTWVPAYTHAMTALSPGFHSAWARLLLEALLARELPAHKRSDGGLRAGVVRSPYWEDIDAEVRAACEGALAALGAAPVELELPFAELAAPAGAVRAGAELGVAVPRELIGELDPVSRGLLQYGALQPARRIVRADRVRARLRRELVGAFGGCELLAWPTNPAPAPPIQAPMLALPSGPALPDAPNIRQAILANLAGVPGVSVPVGFHSSGLPIGLQLLAPWGHESRLLDGAERIERASGGRWASAAPALA